MMHHLASVQRPWSLYPRSEAATHGRGVSNADEWAWQVGGATYLFQPLPQCLYLELVFLQKSVLVERRGRSTPMLVPRAALH